MEAYLGTQVDNLKQERIILVSLLSTLFPSVIGFHTADEGGDDGEYSGRGYVVYLDLPTGQVSFHVGEDCRSTWFEHLQLANIPVWDGHDTDAKWSRIAKLIDGERF
jgi:hypothetical protein